MLVHLVLFWLKPEVSDEDRAAFRAGLESLEAIRAAEAIHVGTPAATPARPAVDGSYDFALTVLLRDMAAHDAYQESPEHQAFLAAHHTKWTRVRIYDAD